jgi:SAM-dependent methyltransferase
MRHEQNVVDHYGHGQVVATVLEALALHGLDGPTLQPEQLAPIDEFHMRGRAATRELIAALDLAPGVEVLDVGCGLGGAARHFAAEVGCRVTGLDLTPEYVEMAELLGRRCGLEQLLEFRQGNALSMPFADGSFDAAISQHAAMNIADKAQLYREVRRVLRPGATLGIYDVLAGPGGPVKFPVPWAADASSSFLATPDQLRQELTNAGFEVVGFSDRTEVCRTWVDALGANAETGAPKLGFHLLLGDAFPLMAQNMGRNLVERRIAPTQVVCRAIG